MNNRITQIRGQEVVDVQNGSRYGRVEDLEIDLEAGKVRALVVPSNRWGFGREKEHIFPWESVRCFGEDIILVDGTAVREMEEAKKKRK